MEELTELGRAVGPLGEVVLRRRGPGPSAVEELYVNGAFAMDSSDASTEAQLAGLALREGCRGQRVLVGGLGLGYTAAEMLRRGAAHVDVVEIEESLLAWARAGVTPTLAAVAADPRVRLHAGDIADVLHGHGLAGPWDAIALDVDNGPDFLIHPANAALYEADLLTAALRRLTPGGTLAIWCQGVTPRLHRRLLDLDPAAGEHLFPVVRGERRIEYAIYTIRSAHSPGRRVPRPECRHERRLSDRARHDG